MNRHDSAPVAHAAPPSYGYAVPHDEPVDARTLSKIVRRHRVLMVLTVLSITAISAVVATNLTPRYTAVATVTIDPQATRVVNTEGVLEEQTRDVRAIETQIRLLESRSFARRVIDHAGLLADPEFNAALRPPESPGLIALHLGRLTEWLSRSVMARTGFSVPERGDDEASVTVGLDNVEDAINTFLGQFEVTRVGKSYALAIQFTSTDPVKAARLANQIAQQYIEEQLTNKQLAAAQVAEWLRRRLTELRAQLLEAESQIARFKADNELIDSQGVTLNSAQLTALHSQLIETRAQRAEKESKLGLLRQVRRGGEGFEAVNEIISSPTIANLRTLQTELLREEAQLQQEYGPRHPKILQLNAEKDRIADRINREVENIIGAFESEVSTLRSREAALQASLDEAKQSVAVGQRAEVELNELQREAEASGTLYKALLERYKKLTEQQETIEAGAEVISTSPVPGGPSFPQPKLIVAVGFTSSLMVAGLLALIAESLRNGLRSTSEIEKVLGVPCFSHVPRVRSRDGCPPHALPIRKPRSAYAEAIRAVHVGLQFAQLERSPRVVLVTSSLPGEGKTTLAVSLAAAAAASGHKTLIIDLDLRRPAVRPTSTQPATAPGIVELIAGEVRLEEAVYADPSQPNLDLITVRRTPANPAEVLASKQLTQLIARLRPRYSLIVLDAPPVLGLTDAKVAMHLVDAALFVVRWGKTTNEIATNGIAALRDCRAPIAGAVLTQVDLKAHARGAYGDAAAYYGGYKGYYLD